MTKKPTKVSRPKVDLNDTDELYVATAMEVLDKGREASAPTKRTR